VGHPTHAEPTCFEDSHRLSREPELSDHDVGVSAECVGTMLRISRRGQVIEQTWVESSPHRRQNLRDGRYYVAGDVSLR